MTGAILVWILINSKRSLFIKRKKIRSFGFFRFSRIFFDGKNWWKILKYKNRNATFWVIFKHCVLAWNFFPSSFSFYDLPKILTPPLLRSIYIAFLTTTLQKLISTHLNYRAAYHPMVQCPFLIKLDEDDKKGMAANVMEV